MANYITHHFATVKNWQIQKTAGKILNKINFKYTEKYSLPTSCQNWNTVAINLSTLALMRQ